MAYEGDKAAEREVARVLARLDGQGEAIKALQALVSGKAQGHLAVTDGEGNVNLKALPAGQPPDVEKLTQRRRAQLEALRRGVHLDEHDSWIEEAPFKEIFAEVWNENPPFLEEPPWNENPPFVEEAPFNENPPFVERVESLRGRTRQVVDSWRWRVEADEPLERTAIVETYERILRQIGE